MSAPDQAQGAIDFDPDVVDDNDSAADLGSVRDSTASVTSSIMNYRTIHGRTFQTSKTTEYWAPNDDKHIESFDVAHHWMTMVLDDKLYAPPLGDNPQRILDVGTGTGIWAIDMADKFPSAEVIGTDISPIQPSWVPPNLSFQIDDAQLDWTFLPESFDFIHVRYMHAGIDDWAKFYRQMYRCLKPGGWFQHMEPELAVASDNPAIVVDENHIFKQWANLFYDAGDKIGRTFRFSGEDMARNARDAGFTGVVNKKLTFPSSPWAKDKKLKEIGLFVGLYVDMSLDGFAVFPIGQILGWSLEEVQVLVAKMREACRNPKNRPLSSMYLTYGQKPKNAESTPASPEKSPSPTAAPTT